MIYTISVDMGDAFTDVVVSDKSGTFTIGKSRPPEPAEAKRIESLIRELIDDGYLASRSFGFISTVTTQSDIDGLVTAMARAMPRVLNGVRE